jgi:hypothetical protein
MPETERRRLVGKSSAAFSKAISSGEIEVDANSIVVVDELSLIGTKDLLKLARLQQQLGFKIVALGDNKQCQSVQAGPVIQILQDGLGRAAIPELLTTVRQRTEREREIAGLFREGKAAEAITLKQEDGTLKLVAGDRRMVARAVARLREDRIAENAAVPGYSIGISAATHADAREISAAVREARLAAGEIGPTAARMKAVGHDGETYDLAVSVGDQVRLHANTNAKFANGKVGTIGRNGSVLEVREISKEGITLRVQNGRTGSVRWSTLQERDGERIRLSLGYCATIDSSQGSTCTEHIETMLSGSAAVTAFKGYSAATRHTTTSFLVISDGAERREVKDRRALGDVRPITDEEVLANVARNRSRQPEEVSTLRMIKRAVTLHRGWGSDLARHMQPEEARVVEGRPQMLHQQFSERTRMRQLAELGHGLVEKLQNLVATIVRSRARQGQGQGMER